MIKACYLTNIDKEYTNNKDSLFIHEALINEITMLALQLVACSVQPVILSLPTAW